LGYSFNENRQVIPIRRQDCRRVFGIEVEYEEIVATSGQAMAFCHEVSTELVRLAFPRNGC
jgi:hypothetical protein